MQLSKGPLFRRCFPSRSKALRTSVATMYSNRLKDFDAPTVWSEFTPLAQRHGAVNLGQGFPDWATPDFVKEALVEAIRSDANQYCRSAGDIPLVEALAEHYGPLVGRKIDPLTEVTISVGATEALFAIMQSMLNDGDEVVTLEPTFDIYMAAIQMAGGVTKAVPLQLNVSSGVWELDFDQFEAKITPRTKLLLLNTPHNPTGKVFTRQELEKIAQILERHPHVTAVTDEVYEKLVYDGLEHVRLASLPGMWDRVLTVSSCGKTFSATGWKVGWAYGAAPLVKGIMLANQWIQYSVSTPTQRALAKILREADKPYEQFPNYYKYVCHSYETKRGVLADALRSANITPYVPQGGFFIMADTSKHSVPQKFLDEPGPTGEAPVTRDWGFARWLTVEHGITPIPPSAFYSLETRDNAKNLARFAFCKTDSLLEEGTKRFATFAAKHQ